MSLSLYIQKFESIGLKGLEKYRLMNRIDTKYFFEREKLQTLLVRLALHYKLLNTNKDRFVSYSSLYFDTKDSTMFLDHHNGNLNRYKVRFREYLDSKSCFLEIKFKNNKGRTIKTRIKAEGINERMKKEELEFINKILPNKLNDIKSRIWIKFNRLTLVHKVKKERLTIDFNLEVSDNQKKVKLYEICIAELKQEKYSSQSDFFRIMKSLKVRPNRISKYCIGMTLLDNTLKYNKFKSKLLSLNKMHNGNIW